MTYLDNAATTFPKPSRVADETLRCIETYCGNPGRGSHKLALAASQKIYECRELLSDFVGLGAPENVIFTENTTYALNMLIKGVLRRGDHVIISDMEHNSVLRPIVKLSKALGVTYDTFKTHPSSEIIPSILRLIRRNTKMVICTHVPNITSKELPIGEIGELCRRKNILFAVDGAQSAGHVHINMSDMNISALCLPGHKGLYGIQGCGALCFRGDRILDTLTEGGNGVNSLDTEMPDEPPERYESGTLPTPAIAALAEGIKEVKSIGVSNIKRHERELFNYTYDALMRLRGVTVYEPREKGAVLLFNITGVPSDRVASALGDMDICVRGGYHCSALGHRTLGTPPGGAVRASFGIFNTMGDADALVYALKRLLKSSEY